METFIKPSGQEVQVNESSRAYAISIGWKIKESEPEKKKPGRPPKAQE